jgi:hypothetical protein
MRVQVLAFAVALFMAAPGFADTGAVAPPAEAPEASAGATEGASTAARAGTGDPDAEVICRTVEETGSRLSRRRQRICGTRTMWDQLADENARGVRRAGSVQARGNENGPN